MVAAQAFIEVQQRSDGPVLVVVQVGPREVSVEVGAKNVGVGDCLEAGQGKAVAPAGVDQFAFQQQCADTVAELRPAVRADQPGGGETGTPFAVEQGAESVYWTSACSRSR
ncbi:MAG TPA: hypothetical protein VHZ03_19625 [Trebonia sp.]|nr:hypothetical protein [Trebonia sp.]